MRPKHTTSVVTQKQDEMVSLSNVGYNKFCARSGLSIYLAAPKNQTDIYC